MFVLKDHARPQSVGVSSICRGDQSADGRGNQMALHTLPGCQHSTSLTHTGFNDGLDCSTAVGSIVHESTPNSSGAGKNDVGGGVWATQFDVNAIQYVLFSGCEKRL